MAITGFEIDFLPVGEESKSGDAILFRYKEYGEYKVILIDGGHKESKGVKTSDTILEHMRKYYYPAANSDAEMRIDHIVCSHPDSDHVGGLQEVMEKCSVGTLWINSPLDYVNYNELEDEYSTEKFSKGNADTVDKLINVAEQKNIPVDPPLQGEVIGPFVVCSPSDEFYKILVKGELERQGGGRTKFKKAAAKIAKLIKAIWDRDALEDYPATSVCNESSTVLFGNFTDGEHKILLTADAGIEALSRSHKYLEGAYRYISGSMTFMQIPHHGSRHNVNTKVLDDILGRRFSENGVGTRGSAFASVAREADDHPRKAVTNAFITRGFLCAATKGNTMWYHRGDMPSRRGWHRVTLIEYAQEVEALDE